MSCRRCRHRDGLIQLPAPRRRHYRHPAPPPYPAGGTGVDHRPRPLPRCSYDRPISAKRNCGRVRGPLPLPRLYAAAGSTDALPGHQPARAGGRRLWRQRLEGGSPRPLRIAQREARLQLVVRHRRSRCSGRASRPAVRPLPRSRRARRSPRAQEGHSIAFRDLRATPPATGRMPPLASLTSAAIRTPRRQSPLASIACSGAAAAPPWCLMPSARRRTRCTAHQDRASRRQEPASAPPRQRVRRRAVTAASAHGQGA